jgi:hypothetical protein
MKILRALGVSIFLSALVLAGPLGADVKAELGFGWSLVAPALSTSYLNQFTPPMTPLSNYVSSSASQTVRLKGKIGYGISGLFNILVADTAGVQVLVDYFRPSLGGSNSNFDVTLNYTTIGPRTYTRQGAWPDSRGDFTETTYSLNGLVRFSLSPELDLRLSGGPTVFYLKGEAMPMGFVSFRLEQDAEVYTLFIKTYQLAYDFGSETTYGGNLGGELAYTVARTIILALDIRYFLSSGADFAMRVMPNEGLTDPIEPIESALNLGTIRINPSYLRMALTLRFKF